MIASTKQIQRLLDVASTAYMNTRNEYESIPMIKDLLIYGNALLRYNNGIIIVPQRRITCMINNETNTSGDRRFCKRIKKIIHSKS